MQYCSMGRGLPGQASATVARSSALVLTFPACRYAVLIDGEEKKAGSLFEDFKPSINPPKEIDDPEDTKPEDWIDEAK